MEKNPVRPEARSVAGSGAAGLRAARAEAEPGDAKALRALRARSVALDEIDLGMASAMHAFQRWIVSAMREAGLKDLSVIEALILDQLRHRARNKRLADICFVLNIEDARVVGYSLRKLVARGIVCAERHRKEVSYSVSAAGEQHLLRYEQIHESRLLDALSMLQLNDFVLPELAQYLRKMSGLYDQAARAASSF